MKRFLNITHNFHVYLMPGTHKHFTSAAAAKSLQSCPTLWPHRRQPTRLRRPWDSPGKNTGVGCHFLLQCMKVKSESEVAQSCPTSSDPMDCSLPASSIHGICQARVLEWGAIAFSVLHIVYYLFQFLLAYSCFTCYITFYCTMKWIHISPPSENSLPSSPSTTHPLGHHRAGRVPTSYLSDTRRHVYINPNRPVLPILPVTSGVCMPILCLRLSDCPANRFICTMPLDPTHNPIQYTIFFFLFQTYFTLYDRL